MTREFTEPGRKYKVGHDGLGEEMAIIEAGWSKDDPLDLEPIKENIYKLTGYEPAFVRKNLLALIAEVEHLRDEKSTIAADLVLEKLLNNWLSDKIDTAQSILSQTQGGMNGAEPKDMVTDLAKLLL